MGLTVVACPMKKEAAVLNEQIGEKSRIVATGVGIKRTVPRLLQIFREARPELLIFTGSVSQLDLNLKTGDVVDAREWCFENGHCTTCDVRLLETLDGSGYSIINRGLSLDRPVLKGAERARLYEATGAGVYDSVTAAALRTAQTEGIPCLAPKIVAHTVGSGLTSFWVNLDRNLAPLARHLSELLEVVV